VDHAGDGLAIFSEEGVSIRSGSQCLGRPIKKLGIEISANRGLLGEEVGPDKFSGIPDVGRWVLEDRELRKGAEGGWGQSCEPKGQ
jgi:hypothetical protein